MQAARDGFGTMLQNALLMSEWKTLVDYIQDKLQSIRIPEVCVLAYRTYYLGQPIINRHKET